MKRRTKVLPTFLALALAAGATALADDTERPKIGLALAGGGAKGGAQVGPNSLGSRQDRSSSPLSIDSPGPRDQA